MQVRPSFVRKVGAWMLLWSLATAAWLDSWRTSALVALFVVGVGIGMGGDSR